ncbi:hypothetical protein LINPERHAP2_LOCUS25075 [Linum perenne]
MGDQEGSQDPEFDASFWSEESDDEGEDDPLCPTIRIPSIEKQRVRRKWEKSLILRTLGKSFPHAFLSRKIQQIWARKGRVGVWDIGFGHFVARFDEEEDYNRAFLDGPWLVGDHYVVSEEWRPNFEPGYSQVSTIRAWIRLPGIPLENFDVGILKLIGNRIGKTIRVDGTTLFGSRGNYARVCVEIDLHKPLISKYRLHRRVRRIEYEGLHEICFLCGRYGHGKQACPLNAETVDTEPNSSAFANPLFQEENERPELEEYFGPWMLAKKKVKRQSPPYKKIADPSAKDCVPSSASNGSRFNALEDNAEGEILTSRVQQVAANHQPQSHGSMHNGTGVEFHKIERQLNFDSVKTKETPRAANNEPSVVNIEEPIAFDKTDQFSFDSSGGSGGTVSVKDRTHKQRDPLRGTKEANYPHQSVKIRSPIPGNPGSKDKDSKGGHPKTKPDGTGQKSGKVKDSQRVGQDGLCGVGASQ